MRVVCEMKLETAGQSCYGVDPSVRAGVESTVLAGPREEKMQDRFQDLLIHPVGRSAASSAIIIDSVRYFVNRLVIWRKIHPTPQAARARSSTRRAVAFARAAADERT